MLSEKIGTSYWSLTDTAAMRSLATMNSVLSKLGVLEKSSMAASAALPCLFVSVLLLFGASCA